jgi:hypothetical protein
MSHEYYHRFDPVPLQTRFPLFPKLITVDTAANGAPASRLYLPIPDTNPAIPMCAEAIPMAMDLAEIFWLDGNCNQAICLFDECVPTLMQLKPSYKTYGTLSHIWKRYVQAHQYTQARRIGTYLCEHEIEFGLNQNPKWTAERRHALIASDAEMKTQRFRELLDLMAQMADWKHLESWRMTVLEDVPLTRGTHDVTFFTDAVR